jgi:hypothetical protein
VLLNAALLATPASACSISGDTATTGGGDATTPSGLPGGFNTSVYLMLGGVFGTMGLVGWVVVKGIRTPSARPGGFPVEKRLPGRTDEKPPQ